MRALLIVLLALAAALAVATTLPLCGGSCGTPMLGRAGAVFYGAALVAVAVWGLVPLIAVALFAAFGFHVGLILTGAACTLCVACSVVSATIAALLVREHAVGLAVAPLAAAAGLAVGAPRPAVEQPRTIIVYEQDGCAFCDHLRRHILPAATSGITVNVAYRPAPLWVRETPTLLVGGTVIRGMPSAEELRQAIEREFGP